MQVTDNYCFLTWLKKNIMKLSYTYTCIQHAYRTIGLYVVSSLCAAGITYSLED